MKKSMTVLTVIGSLIVLFVLFIAVYTLMNPPCNDGVGSSLIIDKKELAKHDPKDIMGTDLDQVEILGGIYYNCGERSYEWADKKTDAELFNHHLQNYNANCDECLVVYENNGIFGSWVQPYNNWEKKYTTREIICGYWTESRTTEDCINLSDI